MVDVFQQDQTGHAPRKEYRPTTENRYRNPFKLCVLLSPLRVFYALTVCLTAIEIWCNDYFVFSYKTQNHGRKSDNVIDVQDCWPADSRPITIPRSNGNPLIAI